MVNITKDNFSIRQICESGQCFRLQRLEGMYMEQKGENEKDFVSEKYALTALGRYLEIEQIGNQIFFDCTQEEFETIWRNYFDLEEDYGRIMGMIDPGDAYLLKAAAYGSGIRILCQDLWEMIISFMGSKQTLCCVAAEQFKTNQKMH